MPPPLPGGVQSIYKKYTLGSTGFWEVIRRFLAVDPNRSTGVPLNPLFRWPTPGRPTPYTDPVTVPAADIANNPYWKRDVRRNYARQSVITQGKIVGLLECGSKAAPKIADGEKGATQLTVVEKEEGKLGSVLKADPSKIKEVLAEEGLPPAPGVGVKWNIDSTVGYEGNYPCRSFV
ncbi:NADH-ubiquinone oxidoreductase subunit [Ascobolus immersus RN42]|uniref:NADH-ubiquinone oxidoreductase subunit n=1 Tax=Ascobolus immersus RN42 TaxID=1160509 RepID=A0A3N4IPV0_ASCIM|nr:NADH-ubiquinone oxidoreductase subunit [Ascobolus immersus RN42]